MKTLFIMLFLLTGVTVSMSSKKLYAQSLSIGNSFWKSVVEKYPKEYKVLAVCEVLPGEMISIIYQNGNKYYNQCVYPKKKTKDEPELLKKLKNGRFASTSFPDESYAIKAKEVEGYVDNDLGEVWRRLDVPLY